MYTNKFFLSLLLGASSIMGAWAQHAAQREYYSDPAKYHYRLKSYQHYGQVFTFNYDEKGYVSSFEVTQDGALETKELFYYDNKGYLIKRDLYGRPRLATGEFDIVSQREEYTRNDKGQIVAFSVSQLLGEDKDDETLSKVREAKITYNSKGLASEAVFTAGVEGTADWAPFRKCKVEYDAQDRIAKLDQVAYPEESEKLMNETFEYNERGQITKLAYFDEATSQGGESVFQYDEEGNLSESGNVDFPHIYTYEKKDIKGANTFFPVPPIALGLYNELRNTHLISLSFPVLYTLSTIAPSKESIKGMEEESEEEGMFVYEAIPMSNVLIRATESNLTPSVVAGVLSAEVSNELIGQQYYLCDVTGSLLQQGVVSSETLSINVENLPQGVYILKVGNQNVKVLL